MAVVAERRHLIEGLSILLVDDVVTYGTHFREAKRVLDAYSGLNIYACALATARHNFDPLSS